MAISDRVREAVLRWLHLSGAYDKEFLDQTTKYDELRKYFVGDQPKQLLIKPGQPDDNVLLNFVRLIVERSVSMLFGGGVDFDLGGATETTDDEGNTVTVANLQQQLINETWDANKQQILLHKLAMLGAIYGTCYIKLLPDGIESRRQPGKILTRLVAINPRWMLIEPDPEDAERINKYIQKWQYEGEDNNGNAMDVQRMETIEREKATQKQAEQAEDGKPVEREQIVETGKWVVRNFVSSRMTGGQWKQIGEDVQWPFEFPPILHWQNLPDPELPYGFSDIGEVMPIQDKTNFAFSNLSKIIRFFAHPQRWSKGVTGSNTIETGPSKIINLVGTDAQLTQLPADADVAGSLSFAQSLRQAMFDISRTVDISSLADRLGQLTNFGLRVLFIDALAKLGTKQELYGDALQELNHRLLRLAGNEGPAAFGGDVIWHDMMPIDRQALSAALVAEYAAGIVSKETAQEQLNYDSKTERERMEAANVEGGTVGEKLLEKFMQGRE